MMQNRYLRLAVIAASVVAADQISKALVLKYVPLHQSISVIQGFFDITHIHNPGGAFGLMANMSATVRTFVFLIISVDEPEQSKTGRKSPDITDDVLSGCRLAHFERLLHGIFT